MDSSVGRPVVALNINEISKYLGFWNSWKWKPSIVKWWGVYFIAIRISSFFTPLRFHFHHFSDKVWPFVRPDRKKWILLKCESMSRLSVTKSSFCQINTNRKKNTHSSSNDTKEKYPILLEEMKKRERFIIIDWFLIQFIPIFISDTFFFRCWCVCSDLERAPMGSYGRPLTVEPNKLLRLKRYLMHSAMKPMLSEHFARLCFYVNSATIQTSFDCTVYTGKH